MKTIVEALQDLYVALGGKEQDVANLLLNPDVIEKIAAVAGDAVKPELPALTGNAGKVLKVDADAEGVEWGEAGGGSGLPTYTATWDDSNISSGTIYAIINTGGVPTLPFKISIPAYTLPAGTEWADPGSELYGSGCVLIPNLLTSSGTAYITTFDNKGNIVLTGYVYVGVPGTIEGYVISAHVDSSGTPVS